MSLTSLTTGHLGGKRMKSFRFQSTSYTTELKECSWNSDRMLPSYRQRPSVVKFWCNLITSTIYIPSKLHQCHVFIQIFIITVSECADILIK